MNSASQTELLNWLNENRKGHWAKELKELFRLSDSMFELNQQLIDGLNLANARLKYLEPICLEQLKNEWRNAPTPQLTEEDTFQLNRDLHKSIELTTP